MERRRIMEPKSTDSSGLFFIKRLIQRFNDDNVTALAAEATYYFILGLIPFMIFLVNSMLFFAAPQIHVIMSLLSYLPDDVAVAMEANILRIIQARSSIWLFIGLAGALWTSSQGVDTLIRSTDLAVYGDRNRQSYIRVNAKSIIFTLFISFAMILSLGLIVFGNAVVYAIAYYFHVPEILLKLWTVVKFGIPFVIIAFSLAVFYEYAPAGRRSDWRRVITSAFLVTSIWIALTAAYGYYILHVSSMGLTYGSLIGLVVLFIWFHLAAMVIIAGGELIVTWDETVERSRLEGSEDSEGSAR
jgi:membrane protein